MGTGCQWGEGSLRTLWTLGRQLHRRQTLSQQFNMLQVEVPSAGAVRWALGVSGERPP